MLGADGRLLALLLRHLQTQRQQPLQVRASWRELNHSPPKG